MKPNEFKVLPVLSYGNHEQCINPTMRGALSTIASEQAKPTEKMGADVNQLLDYAATHPDAVTHSLPVTCNSILTAMPVTSMSQAHEADLEDTSILETNSMQKISAMEHFTTTPVSLTS
jgi:hypothetical protein